MLRILVVIPFMLFLLMYTAAVHCLAADAQRVRRVAVVVCVDGSPWFERMRQAVDALSIANLSNQSEQWYEQTGNADGNDGAEDDVFLIGPARATQEEQNALIEEMIVDGVDALCVVPITPGDIGPALSRARAEGIRIVVLGVPVDDCDIALEPFENASRDFSHDSVAGRYLDWESAYQSRRETDPSAGGTRTKLYDPAAAGAAMIDLALMLLDGKTISDRLDLGIDGYHDVRIRPTDPRQLSGDAWLFVDKNKTVDAEF